MKHIFSRKKSFIILALLLFVLFILLGIIGYIKIVNFLAAKKIETTTNTILLQCEKHDIRETCYIKEFSLLSNKENLPTVKSVLLELQDHDPQARRCHYIAHGIALATVKKDPEDWKRFLAEEDPYFCSEGFLHGALEAHLSKVGYRSDKNLLGKICKEVDKGSRNEYSCAHVIGHLLLVDMNVNIPDSLEQCDKLTPEEDVNFREECYNGVFMEVMDQKNIAAHKIREPIQWNEEFIATMEIECKKYTQLAATTCWKMLSRVYTEVYQANAIKIFNACDQAQDQKSKDYCYIRAVGVIPQSNYFKEADINKICSVHTSEKKFILCNDFLVQFTLRNSPKFSRLVSNYCEQLKGQPRKKCLAAIEYYGDTKEKKSLQDIILDPISTFF